MGRGLSYNSTLSASTGVSASTRNQLDVDAFRLLRWNNWFYEGLATFLQSSEQGIIRQGTFGGGVGRYLKNTNSARISVLAGFAGQNTDYAQNTAPQKLAAGLSRQTCDSSGSTKPMATLLPLSCRPFQSRVA